VLRSIAAAFRKASIALSQSWFRLAWAPSLANLVASGLPCPRANCGREIASMAIRQRAEKVFMGLRFDDEFELRIRIATTRILNPEAARHVSSGAGPCSMSILGSGSGAV